MRYNYWLLRYVPDSVRGEFVNVAVIVGSDDSGDWALRRADSLRRASRLGGDASVIEDWLTRLSTSISSQATMLRPAVSSGSLRPSFASLDRVRRQLNNTFQISTPTPVLATSAEAAAERLFTQLVSVAEPRPKVALRAAAVRELKEAFYQAGDLGSKEVQQNVRLHVGRQQARFEFAIGQSRVAQLSHVWSFNRQGISDLAQEIQAASYAINRLRERGGRLENPNRPTQRDVELPPDIPVRVLYVPPETAQQQEIFGNAEEAWADLGVLPFPVGDENRIAREAVALLRAG
jgi:hypothetical protein